MTDYQIFETFLSNLRIDNETRSKISFKYGEITNSLNVNFRKKESKVENTLIVGSLGRNTAIKGLSDLDMIYIMPDCTWTKYKDCYRELLTDTKNAISKRYPKTEVSVDRLVVVVSFTHYKIEVQPVYEFKDEDGISIYKYPDTYDGGAWKITKPRHEQIAINKFDKEVSSNIKPLCKMLRAWKNHVGFPMGGLLIDSLVYNFLIEKTKYQKSSFSEYGVILRDLFFYLKNYNANSYICALGSNQQVYIKKKFQRYASEAYDLCHQALESTSEKETNIKWRKIFGRFFPINGIQKDSAILGYDNTEEFIEDVYSVDIQYTLELDCEVKQDGFIPRKLKEMLKQNIRLKHGKQLLFMITKCDVPEPYKIKWKVRNVGELAEKKNDIRGQIITGSSDGKHKENSKFDGPHYVECYIIKDDVVVARNRIDVPINN